MVRRVHRTIAYAFRGPRNPAELFVRKANVYRTDALVQKLTSLNEPLLANKALAVVETFTFKSFDGRDVEAVLTIRHANGFEPGKHPLIVSIHGGPHSQSGVAFAKNAQVYAAQGWATLSVNCSRVGCRWPAVRGRRACPATRTVAMRRMCWQAWTPHLLDTLWLDRERLGIEGGSYGGQLTNSIITRSDRFSAAIPIAGISNLVSFDYMSYYHDYLAAEFGAPVQEDGELDRSAERSPLRYARNATTPTLFVHGENDNDVPIAEAEQLLDIALKDAGVDTTLLRYPREGHELRETAHVVDRFDRSIAWYAETLRRAPPGVLLEASRCRANLTLHVSHPGVQPKVLRASRTGAMKVSVLDSCLSSLGVTRQHHCSRSVDGDSRSRDERTRQLVSTR